MSCSELQSKSLGLWSELEKESGSKLMDVNGLLFYGEADTGETVEGSIPGAREVCAWPSCSIPRPRQVPC